MSKLLSFLGMAALLASSAHAEDTRKGVPFLGERRPFYRALVCVDRQPLDSVIAGARDETGLGIFAAYHKLVDDPDSSCEKTDLVGAVVTNIEFVFVGNLFNNTHAKCQLLRVAIISEISKDGPGYVFFTYKRGEDMGCLQKT